VIVIFWLLLWAACACGGVFLAERRGQGKVLGFVLGLLFGPFGVFLVWCSIDDPRQIEESLIEKSQAKRCTACWSIAHPRANLCPACRTAFA
jgi:hypothetical protein